MSKELDQESVKRLELIIDQWRWAKGEATELRRAYQNDRRVLSRILTMYKNYKWQDAGDLFRHIDHSLSKLIPPRIKEHITNA